MTPTALATEVSYVRLSWEAVRVKPVPNSSYLASQTRWLEDLVRCESRGDPAAVNPKDRDGTPSYGLLQFKPSTFEQFSKAYGIEGDLMDPAAQRAIVLRMMRDPSVRWGIQFPDCVKKFIGPPPGALGRI